MKNSGGASAGGCTFFGLLTIAFVVLKLCNVIKWSWLWVLSPIWIPLSLGLVFCILVFILYSAANR